MGRKRRHEHGRDPSISDGPNPKHRRKASSSQHLPSTRLAANIIHQNSHTTSTACSPTNETPHLHIRADSSHNSATSPPKRSPSASNSNSNNPQPPPPLLQSPRPVIDPHTSPAPAEKAARARSLLALQAQIAFELEHDGALRDEYTSLAGAELSTAALNLGQVLSSAQPLLLSIAPRSSTLQEIPSVPTYHDSAASPVPALPPIADPDLRDLPFTHRGTVPEAVLHNNANSHYERLEFLGDAYIELAATRFLFERFPNKSVGSIAHMREDLVKNETLAGFSLLYNFDERARLSEQYRNEYARGAHSSKPYVKILGDMFEAYVAAAVISHPKLGYGAVEGWLWALWRRRLPGKHELKALNGMAKSELARKVMGKGIRLQYEDVGEPVDKGIAGRLSYTVCVKIYGWGWDGVELGRGEDWGKPPAGVRAAMQALQNPLTGQIQEIKKTFDTLVKQEREKDGGPDPAVLEQLDWQWKHAPKKDTTQGKHFQGV